MPLYNYKQLRKVLRKLDFKKIRIGKHETWEKILQDGTILQVRVSHKGKRDIPKGTFVVSCQSISN
ncbi:TPA: type II toxin-antitoxin system HicA family toxin [Candidatus Poribacteria bacterium]|nr:type II toxin-antitoxin system HicA family toxin [Candidatus Poribacteria bacterium]